ncbi:hypothetical protein SAMN02910368_01323 [Lachnospiraceae bacterium G11]|nr:hypothetical protein SAMN02910368_01323 [Lachnospiraceae bacterium G11]
MVKKNLVNKNVVRALSIGLSLAMASQPLTAMAAEPADDAPVREPIANAPAVETQSAAEVAEAKAAEVKEDVDTDTANVNDVVDLTKDAISKAEALDVDASAANTDVQTLESGKKAAGVQEELQKITSETTGETVLNTALAQGVATAEANVTKPVVDAEKAVFGDKEEEVESLSEKIENADAAIKDASGKIAGATTPGAANSAYNDAATAVNDADTAVKAAEEKVETAQKELEVKEDEYDSLAEQYEAALKAYNDKVDALNQAKADALKKLGLPATREGEKVVGLTDELAELFAEDDQEVAKMKGSLEDLKSELDAAEKEYKSSGYGYIAALENAIIEKQNKTAEYGTGVGTPLTDVDISAVEDENNRTKATYRNLFKAIVQTYYVPEVLKGEFVSIVAEDCGSGIYYYDGDTTDKNNESTNGDVLRVFTVTYKELDENGHVKKDENGNDVEKTIRLNYKTANENKKNGYQGIVIFEKTEHKVYDHTDLTATQIANLEAGQIVTLADGTKLVKATGSDQYVAITGEGTVKEGTTEIVADSDASDGQTVSIGTQTEEWTFVDGTLTKTVKADVTTTTYTGATLAEKANTSFNDQTASQNDFLTSLKAIISGAVAEGKTPIIRDADGNEVDLTNKTDTELLAYYDETFDTQVTEKTYTIEVSYNQKYTASKHISGTRYHNVVNWEISESEAREDFDDKADDFVDDYRYRDGVFSDQNSTDVIGDPVKTFRSWEVNRDKEGWPIKVDVCDRSYEGDVTVEYAKLSSMVVDKSWFVFTGGSVNKDTAADVLASRGVSGAKVVKLDKWFDEGGAGSYTVYYYINDGSETVTVDAANESGITQASVESALATKLGSSNYNNVTYTKTGEAVKSTKTTYGYNKLNLFLKASTTETNKTISTREWVKTDAEDAQSKIVGETHDEYRNDNWYSGNVVSTKVDKDNNFVAGYRTDGKGQGGNKTAAVLDDVQSKSTSLIANINAAKTKINEYETAKAAVATAEQKVKEAEGEVETLKGLIEQISFSKKDSILAGLRSRLETAETELATAKAARDQLLEDLRTLDGQRAQRIIALTSAPSGEGGGETGGEGGTTTAPGLTVLPGAEAPLAAAPAMFVAAPGGAGAPAAAVAEDNTVTLTEQRAALSDAVPEAQTEQSTENIDDGKTALAAAPVSEETLSWWWLLIIAVLGGAGYAMYRKFHNKKDEKTTN